MPRREQLERMLADDPTDAFLNYAFAMALLSEGRRAEAIDRFRALLSQHADHIPGHFQLGQALAQSGDADGARAILQTGIAVAARAGDQHAEAEMQTFLESL